MAQLSVLVVDDQIQWVEMANDLLQDHFLVDTATSYDEAIKKIEKKKPPYNVLISDIRLNEGDPRNTQGLEIAEYLNDQGLGDITKIIFWTAYESYETAIRATKLNAIEYFPKTKKGSDGRIIPFDDIREEFIEKVKQASELSIQKRWDKSILIIDENTEWLNKLSNLLNNYGYETNILSDLTKTISYIKQRNFRAVITELPTNNKQDYFKFIKRINSSKPGTKIIIVSDHGSKKTVRDAFVKHSVVDLFLKEDTDGFKEKDFIERIEKIFRPENELFIVANIEKKLSNTYIYSLKTEKHVLTNENAITIWFPPYKKELEIDVFIYAESNVEDTGEIIINPSGTQRLIISKNKESEPSDTRNMDSEDSNKQYITSKPVQFTITAQSNEQFYIYAELFEIEQGWWKRIQSMSTNNK